MVNFLIRLIVTLCLLNLVGGRRYKIGVWAYHESLVQEWYGPVLRQLNSYNGSLALEGASFDVTNIAAASLEYSISEELDRVVARGEVDFVIGESLQTTCWAAQERTAPLLTRKDRVLAGAVDECVIFAAIDRQDINVLEDVKGKIIAGQDPYWMDSFSAQVQTLQKAGINIWVDAKQVIFHDGGGDDDIQALIERVADGVYDVGFFGGATVEYFIQGRYKKLNQKTDGSVSQIPGNPHSTISALSHVEPEAIHHLYGALTSLHTQPWSSHASEWVPGVPFGAMRNALQATGAMYIDGSDNWKCRLNRENNNYESIICPKGYVKLSPELVAKNCEILGIACPKGTLCICSPCIQASEVDVMPINSLMDARTNGTRTSCQSKMALCAVTEQKRPLQFRFRDNRFRIGANLSFRLYDQGVDDDDTANVGFAELVAPYNYTTLIETAYEGIFVLEIFLNEVQIPQSPIRIKVNPRVCTGEYRIANEVGECVCDPRTVKISGNCVDSVVLSLTVVLTTLFFLLFLAGLFLWRIQVQRDAVWKIDIHQLGFPEPAEVLGQGSYGEVVKAYYMGTEVAVKRAIPAREKRDSSVGNLFRKSVGSFTGRGPGTGFRRSITEFRPCISTLEMAKPNQSFQEPVAIAISQDAASPASKNYMAEEVAQRTPSSPQGRASGSRTQEGITLQLRDTTRSRSASHMVSLAKNSLASSFSTRQGSLAATTTNQAKQDFRNEIRALARIRHPCIVTIMGAVVEKDQAMLVMELMHRGSLYDLYSNELVAFSGAIIHPILIDIATGLHFLHSNRPAIVHGDLKASNVLVDERFRGKVADFGLSNTRRKGRGSPFWMAPELLTGADIPSDKSDVYAFGVTVCEVLSRKEPFENQDWRSVAAQVLNSVDPVRPSVPEASPQTLKNVVQQCFLARSEERPNFGTIRGLLISGMNPSQYEILWPSSETAEPDDSTPAIEMLSSIFPKNLAEAMVRGDRLHEERSDCATILFSEIVDFEGIKGFLESDQVTELLERLNIKLNALAELHGVFKLDTLLSGFVGVTNVVEDQESDHAARMARFALGMVQAARETLLVPADPTKGNITVRVGFECGPVVGSIVGTGDRRYTVHGGAVTVAHRIQAAATPGEVHISHRAADLLLNQDRGFMVKDAGSCVIKGRRTLQLKKVEGWGALAERSPSSSRLMF